LQQCISSLTGGSKSPDLIVVVDNASTDGSQEWLKAQNQVKSYCLDTNQGGSFAFTYGMEKALELGADWIWTMDEDVEIEKDCLKNMLALADQHPGVDYWCPTVLTPNQEINVNSLPEIDASLNLITSTFIGTLQRASCLKQFGLPISNMFRFYDDIEFYWRIGQQGAIGRMAPDCEITHLSTGKSEVDYLKEIHTDKWAPLYFKNQYFFLGLKNGKLNQIKKLTGDIKLATRLNNRLFSNTLKLTQAYTNSLIFKPTYGTK
jgi:GT2 family glycosyltransferase